jgi:hypothetical protein
MLPDVFKDKQRKFKGQGAKRPAFFGSWNKSLTSRKEAKKELPRDVEHARIILYCSDLRERRIAT